MQIVSIGDNLHEMSKPVLSKKKKKKKKKKNMKNISVCHLLKILPRMPKFFEIWGKESMSQNI